MVKYIWSTLVVMGVFLLALAAVIVTVVFAFVQMVAVPVAILAFAYWLVVL